MNNELTGHEPTIGGGDEIIMDGLADVADLNDHLTEVVKALRRVNAVPRHKTAELRRNVMMAYYYALPQECQERAKTILDVPTLDEIEMMASLERQFPSWHP